MLYTLKRELQRKRPRSRPAAGTYPSELVYMAARVSTIECCADTRRGPTAAGVPAAFADPGVCVLWTKRPNHQSLLHPQHTCTLWNFFEVGRVVGFPQTPACCPIF